MGGVPQKAELKRLKQENPEPRADEILKAC
jgi:hypothetical protein